MQFAARCLFNRRRTTMSTPSQGFPISPERFSVRVLMERRSVRGNPWVKESWHALGVMVGTGRGAASSEPAEVVRSPNAAQFLWGGLSVELHPDEAESYYHNLTVEEPACYVVTHAREDGVPEPFLVTVSFDAAQAYLEGDETVYSVPLPPELYRAAETYVLTHYVPEKKRKRKLLGLKEKFHGGH
jgi:hypothetical protein